MIKSIPQVDILPTYPVLWTSSDYCTKATIHRPDGTKSRVTFWTRGAPAGVNVPADLADSFGVIITYDTIQPKVILRSKEGDPTSNKHDGNTLIHAITAFFNVVLINPALYSYVMLPWVESKEGEDVDLLRIEKILKQYLKVNPENIQINPDKSTATLYPLEGFTNENS
ncbi:hypothetical protein Peetri_00144 [Pseudomonas phage vB_PpuM-Peetri]